MKFVTDLHLHSKYSRAVSQDMVLPKMAEWAKMKGIDVLACGDFTHPFWFDQLKNELCEAGKGLYKLKSTVNSSQLTGRNHQLLTENREPVHFLLSCEISSIYSQGGKTRRIHNLFFFQSLESVSKFNSSLIKRGANLRSDGRPIMGISAKDLAKIALNVDSKALIIPAHAWTPWFSVFGSFSGFDSVEECFGDMAPYIYGIETGLSSDPAMNWQIADLDGRAILSFSDAHSLEKMGREATVFEAEEISYDSIYWAIWNARGPVTSFPPASARSRPKSNRNQKDNVELRAVGNPSTGATPRTKLSNHPTIQPSNYPSKIAFTIEFYPEEGKYHFTGHRDCGVSQSPEETLQNGDICPVCGKQLTVGVIHRVEELKTRNPKYEIRDMNGVRWVYPAGDRRPPFVSLVPLSEIIAEAFESAAKTKKVFDQYRLLVDNLGSEFGVLLKVDIGEIAKFAQPKVVDGIEKVRSGDIKIEPGYDGKFGVVKIWDEDVQKQKENTNDAQLNLFV
ncbi:hypothetical protein A3B51_01545 [Candidatus Curtissbacteria bacterium RIFCSPLOWO2_01_FULL_41_18]|uniref:DNA helicase UvrD n=1 Tax=Candidatus Curtissbacteria bacterium RIFCSPLOWO2_01_FULL_41_18 TaxID=1797727 RepID=A0A1F5HID0_9BACT|nr:MAG: hypothetical protein A3B51_01545 [Candidatus Curtissbacteria bacterium RIFCSPLOWO2_01_FULL_41_18]